ncbi:MAG: hypothetical protein M3O70_03360 [Actinomycetota bacterium]|nr:hypothetical protein [Actinomycetota bacterium]
MHSAVRLRGALVDRITQRWVVASGRPVDFTGSGGWLDGPVGSPDGIGDDWIHQHARRANALLVEEADGGLIPDMGVLDGAGFRAAALHSEVRDFYQRTAGWKLDVWSRWARWAEPGGRAINAIFARRLRQLSLLMDPLDVAYGMDSRVVAVKTAEDSHLGTVWQRTLRATGGTVFGGFYGIVSLPASIRPSIRVVFPLPNGSVTVFLRPEVTPRGGLLLTSPSGRFGDDGAYLVVRPDASDRGWARRIPLPERFHVFVDDDQQLRCDHELRLGPVEILRLHYRLTAA